MASFMTVIQRKVEKGSGFWSFNIFTLKFRQTAVIFLKRKITAWQLRTSQFLRQHFSVESYGQKAVPFTGVVLHNTLPQHLIWQPDDSTPWRPWPSAQLSRLLHLKAQHPHLQPTPPGAEVLGALHSSKNLGGNSWAPVRQPLTNENLSHDSKYPAIILCREGHVDNLRLQNDKKILTMGKILVRTLATIFSRWEGKSC